MMLPCATCRQPRLPKSFTNTHSFLGKRITHCRKAAASPLPADSHRDHQKSVEAEPPPAVVGDGRTLEYGDRGGGLR